MYVWVIAMLVQRVTVCVMGVLVCVQRHNRLTILAKVSFTHEEVNGVCFIKGSLDAWTAAFGCG